MNFKADENLPHSAVAVLRAARHEVHTVLQEAMGGAADRAILDVCREEGRALVTLDKDLTDIRAYPPHEFAGIIVLRPRDQRASTLASVLARVLPLLETEQLSGALWIADDQRVRIRR